MAAQKKRTPAKKKASTAKRVVRKNKTARGVEDFFDPETGELLNPQHELFAQAWVQTFNVPKAVAIAGYTGKTEQQAKTSARRLLRREDVQRRVRDILSERVRDFAIDKNWVVLELLDLIEKGKTPAPITNKDGDILGYEYNDLRTALGAAVKIGENLGMFQKKDDAPQRAITIINNYGPDAEQPKDITRAPLEGQAKRLN